MPLPEAQLAQGASLSRREDAAGAFALRNRHACFAGRVRNSEQPARTRRRDLTAIRSFLKHVQTSLGPLNQRVFQIRVKLRQLTHEMIEPKHVQLFTDAEIAMIVATAPPFWRCATIISNATALRLGDVAQLQWGSITKDSIVVWTEKRDRRVCLNIGDEVTPGLRGVVNELLGQWDVRLSPYIWPEFAAVATGDPSKRAKLSVYYSRLLHRAGVEGKSFRGLRHTCISRWRRMGFTLEQATTFDEQTRSPRRGRWASWPRNTMREDAGSRPSNCGPRSTHSPNRRAPCTRVTRAKFNRRPAR